ncbi:unnamed protein product, partial [Trichogramma brassicae]
RQPLALFEINDFTHILFNYSLVSTVRVRLRHRRQFARRKGKRERVKKKVSGRKKTFVNVGMIVMFHKHVNVCNCCLINCDWHHVSKSEILGIQALFSASLLKRSFRISRCSGRLKKKNETSQAMYRSKALSDTLLVDEITGYPAKQAKGKAKSASIRSCGYWHGLSAIRHRRMKIAKLRSSRRKCGPRVEAAAQVLIRSQRMGCVFCHIRHVNRCFAISSCYYEQKQQKKTKKELIFVSNYSSSSPPFSSQPRKIPPPRSASKQGKRAGALVAFRVWNILRAFYRFAYYWRSNSNNVIGSIRSNSLRSMKGSMRKMKLSVHWSDSEFLRFVFSPGVVEPVPEVERVPLKKKTRAMSSASEAVKKPRSLCELEANRITISRSPRRGHARLAIDGAQHSQDDVRSENHTHKRALDAGAKAQQERMMAPEARTTLTRRQQKGVSTTHGDSQGSAGSENHTHKMRIFEVRFFAWCGRACARGGAGTTQKEDPGYVISLRSGKKTPITVRAGSDRITISRSPRRGLTKLAIDGAQHSHDEVRSENHTHKRAPDAGAKAQLERMMAPEARTTLTR